MMARQMGFVQPCVVSYQALVTFFLVNLYKKLLMIKQRKLKHFIINTQHACKSTTLFLHAQKKDTYFHLSDIHPIL